MEFCFTDEDVGTLSSRAIEEITYPNKIASVCAHVIYLVCAPVKKPPPTPTQACSAYLTAAINTEHQIMFTSPRMFTSKAKMDVLNVKKDAKPEFGRNADTFIRTHGANWYFCRCKPEIMEECESLAFL